MNRGGDSFRFVNFCEWSNVSIVEGEILGG